MNLSGRVVCFAIGYLAALGYGSYLLLEVVHNTLTITTEITDDPFQERD